MEAVNAARNNIGYLKVPKVFGAPRQMHAGILC